MTSIQETPIEQKAVATPRERFRGALLRPGEEGYDEARRIWNGTIHRRPALIARCAGTDDVVEAVRFARERDGNARDFCQASLQPYGALLLAEFDRNAADAKDQRGCCAPRSA